MNFKRGFWFACIILLVAIGCAPKPNEYIQTQKIRTESLINSEFIGHSGKYYRVYKRKVPGGTIYEYHLENVMDRAIAEGLRIIFISDTTQSN